MEAPLDPSHLDKRAISGLTDAIDTLNAVPTVPGEVWSLTHGSHVPRSGLLNAAVIVST